MSYQQEKLVDMKLLSISVLLTKLTNEIEYLPPTEFRDELRIEIHNAFEILGRYTESLK